MYEFTLTVDNCQKVLYHVWWLRHFGIPYRINRAPNTQYVISLSYGKDSLCCVQACRELGLPLDACIHAEVWATDTIPAELPPMVEFKGKADAILKDRYGLDVVHVCATKRSHSRNVERERDADRVSQKRSATHERLTNKCFIIDSQKENSSEQSKVSRKLSADGASISKKMPSETLSKLTFEDCFYHVPKRKDNSQFVQAEREQGRTNPRVPASRRAVVQQQPQKIASQSMDFRAERDGAPVRSNVESSINGFPISINRGQWCQRLKLFRLCPSRRAKR